MRNTKFSDDFKRDAVHQIVERGYPNAWKKTFAKSGSGSRPACDQTAEV